MGLNRAVKAFHFLMGRYDTARVLDAANNETAAQRAPAIGTVGNVEAETLRALIESEHRQRVAGLP